MQLSSRSCYRQATLLVRVGTLLHRGHLLITPASRLTVLTLSQERLVGTPCREFCGTTPWLSFSFGLDWVGMGLGEVLFSRAFFLLGKVLYDIMSDIRCYEWRWWWWLKLFALYRPCQIWMSIPPLVRLVMFIYMYLDQRDGCGCFDLLFASITRG